MSDTLFHIVQVVVPDRSIYDAGVPKLVTRYALQDDSGVIWLNGHSFGFLRNMVQADRSSRDCRNLLRDTPEAAWNDMPQGLS